jgi:hypothetical protein
MPNPAVAASTFLPRTEEPMPKPRLRSPYNALKDQLTDAMLQGTREFRHHYPKTESEMRGAVLALLAAFEVVPRTTPLTLEDMIDRSPRVEPPPPPAPPKPQPTDSQFADELLAAMVVGLHEWRPDLDFPESYSDLLACAFEVLARFDIQPRETPFRVKDMAWPQAPDADRTIAVPVNGHREPHA